MSTLNGGAKGGDLVLTIGGYRRGVRALTRQEKADIEAELTVTPRSKEGIPAKQSFPIYFRNGEYVYLPVEWATARYGPAVDERPRPAHLSGIQFTGELREEQKEPAETLLRHFMGHSAEQKKNEKGAGGVAVWPTGAGKTVLGAYLLAALGVKTLIVVPRVIVGEAWREALLQFTNLSDSHIGLLKGDSDATAVALLRPVVIATIKGLYDKGLSSRDASSFGLTIYDECHKLPCEHYSECLRRMSTKYRLGLTATPHRDDGCDSLNYLFIGPIVSEIKKTENHRQPVVVQLFRYPIDDRLKECPVNSLGKADFTGVVGMVLDDKARNELLLSMVLRYAKEEARYILVLSSRREHAIVLAVAYTEACRRLETAGSPASSSSSSSPLLLPEATLCLGGIKKSELNAVYQSRLIFATYDMCSDAFNYPALNTIILAAPRAKMEQTVGRILRQVHDVTPTVAEPYDAFHVLFAQQKKKIKFYKESGYTIEYMNANESDVSETDAYDD